MNFIPRRLLRSNAVWRLSGLTYTTAVRATRGRYVTPNDYLKDCKTQMTFLLPYIEPSMSVLELGCGIGGNLLALSPSFSEGLGLDTNPGYLRQGRRLAAKTGITNVSFSVYDGLNLTSLKVRPQVAFSIGVFERLTYTHVTSLVRQLLSAVPTGGLLAIYFLAERARNSKFSELLGSDAYVYWTGSDVQRLINELPGRLSTVEMVSWEFADVYVLRKEH